MPLNRIYQGRVSGIEFDRAIGKTADWQPAPGGDESLWRHHALFQDAINYYLVGLLALASRENAILGPLLAELDKPGSPRQIWDEFRRRGKNRPGLAASVAPYLTPGNPKPTMSEAFAAILAGNEADEELRDLCVSELLAVCAGDSPIKNEGGWMLSRFCVPSYNGGFPYDKASALRDHGESLLYTTLHQLKTCKELSDFAQQIEIGWLVNPTKGSKPSTGEDARQRLRKALSHFEQFFGTRTSQTEMGEKVKKFLSTRPDASKELAQVAARLTAMPIEALPSIPANNRSIPDRLEAGLLFKYFPGEFTADLLRVSYPPKEPRKRTTDFTSDEERDFTRFGGDAIELARGERGFVFPCFTALPCWAKSSEPNEPNWREFDIAAFKGALLSIHQIRAKTEERKAEIISIKADLAYMHGEKPKSASATTSGDDDTETLPVLKNDPRIPLLRAAVASLKTDTALTDGDAVAYGLQRRTVRGFRDLRRIWRAHAPAGVSFSAELQKKLHADLRKFQTDNSATLGSETLFRTLLEEANWPIWQEPDSDTARQWDDAGFADNPLDALVQETELKEDIERLSEPVKLTPAHPVYSRRQYDFNAVSKFGAGSRAAHRHEPGRCAFTTEIAAQESGLWQPVRTRVIYSAPRLLRDGLRREDNGEPLAAAPWLQPMMEALAPLPELPQDLTDMPVMLMPDMTASGERRVLLNFPVTLEPEKLVTHLGKRDAWLGQFCGTFDEPFALRWPADGEGKAPKGKAVVPWFESRKKFTVLGVDLGTRDAGALAHLTVTAGEPIKSVSRVVGEAGGETWRASLTDMRLIKLPGEDATVFARGEKQPEPYGDKGRMPSLREIDETREIIEALGQNPEDFLRERERLSFPELNDKLLIVLRRAQGRLARLQGWSWKLRDSTQTATAREDMLECGDALASTLPADNALASDLVAKELIVHRRRISNALVQIANRVVPLRGRHWTWQPRADLPSCHILQQTDPGSNTTTHLLAGQRGISHRRIEQLEELRHRCQSLNRALQHLPGEKARMGRRTKGDELPDPCPDLLEKMERLREQRVDQTAHAILAAALGVRLRAPSKNRTERTKRDIHGEYERFRDPVDFIAIENLSRYLSSQDRARRENTRLMQWCHRQLVQKLRQLCESYGIPVLAAPAAYSSRFSSRDGSAGFRAVEVTAADRRQWPWKQDLAKLAQHESGEKKLDAKALASAEYVRRLFDQLDAAEATRPPLSPGQKRLPRTLLAPLPGGPIFIPLGNTPPMQADLNAAANIALRAIAAPDRHDIHQRIRTERKRHGGQLQLRRDSQREKARWPGNLPTLHLPRTDEPDDRQPNVFADVSYVSFADKRVKIDGISVPFATGKMLWTAVKIKSWNRVVQINEERLRKWRDKPDTSTPRQSEL